MNGSERTIEEKSKSDGVKSKSIVIRLLVIFLSGYNNIDKTLENSAVFRLFRVFGSFTSSLLGVIKRNIARAVENSRIAAGIDGFGDRLLGKSLRYYGVGLFFYGLFYFGIAFASELGRSGEHTSVLLSDMSFIVPGISVLVIAAVMMTSTSSLASQILGSKFACTLLFDYFCFDRKRVAEIKPSEHSHTVPIILGMLLGILTVRISPIYFVKCAVYLICLFAIIKAPENGVIFVLLSLPFAVDRSFVGILGLVAVSYLFKVLRMKRVFKLDFSDIFFGILCLIILLCGIFGIDYSNSLIHSLSVVLCFFFGFIVANTMKTSLLAKRCINAILLSSSVAAIIMILLFFVKRYGLGELNSTFEELFGLLSYVLYDNGAAIYELFVILLPLSLSKKSFSDGGISFTSGIVSFLLLLTACVLSFDTSVWLSCTAALVVYFCVLKPFLIAPTALAAFASAVLLFSFPKQVSVISDFLEEVIGLGYDFDKIGAASELGMGLLSEIGLWGVGSGKDAIGNVLSYHFGAGVSSYAYDLPLILSLTIRYGVPIIVVCGVCYLVFLSRSTTFYYFETEYPAELKPYVAATIASLSFIAVRSAFIPSLLSIQTVAVLCFMLYFGIAVKRSVIGEYVPHGVNVLVHKDNQT